MVTKTNNSTYISLFEEDICKVKYFMHFGDDYINKIEFRIDNLFWKDVLKGMQPLN